MIVVPPTKLGFPRSQTWIKASADRVRGWGVHELRWSRCERVLSLKGFVSAKRRDCGKGSEDEAYIMVCMVYSANRPEARCCYVLFV